jgi:hypothetical protein
MLLALTLLVSLFLLVAGVAYLVTFSKPDKGGAVTISWTLVAAFAMLFAALLALCPGEKRSVKILYAALLGIYIANAAAVAPHAYKSVIDQAGFLRYLPVLLIGVAIGGQAILIWRVVVWQKCGAEAGRASRVQARRGSSL